MTIGLRRGSVELVEHQEGWTDAGKECIRLLSSIGERESVDWIFSMRANARLLEPEWLKDRISSTLDEMASLYRTSF